MSIRNLFFSCFFVFTLSACSGELFLTHTGNMPAPDKIEKLKTGQTQAEVIDLLGTPSSISTFDRSNWIYMSSTVRKVAFFKPEEIDRNILELKFDTHGKVSEITRLTLNDGQSVSIDSDQTETAGHNIGFFRKYFGGVGTYMPVSPSKSAD